jgi:hypothetical protein
VSAVEAELVQDGGVHELQRAVREFIAGRREGRDNELHQLPVRVPGYNVTIIQ